MKLRIWDFLIHLRLGAACVGDDHLRLGRSRPSGRVDLSFRFRNICGGWYLWWLLVFILKSPGIKCRP
ncbi:uncharacterized protein ARMOST_17264 [Armillaria ostoyae]|uniref:Uncharacterized protein n=1 Tax=Armillaria ostoyae TaxID=47428 RepID=A0A284RYM4_ARMOS|nr:uncharacterized protein ARMOST_17264 [Armillaria ostoyae]